MHALRESAPEVYSNNYTIDTDGKRLNRHKSVWRD